MTDWQDTHGTRTGREGIYAPDKQGYYEWRPNVDYDAERVVAYFDEYGMATITLEAFEALIEAGPRYHRVAGPTENPPEGI